MTTKFYNGRKALLDDLNEKSGGDIDINKSLFLSLFGFVTKEGKQCSCINSVSLAKEFNSLYGDIIVPQKTRTVGNKHAFMVTYNTVEAKPVSPESIPEAVKEVVTGEIKEVIVETPSTPDTPDFEYAESLSEGKSKTEAKDALEAYGRQFNVELAKNKKFESMIIDFKEAVA